MNDRLSVTGTGLTKTVAAALVLICCVVLFSCSKKKGGTGEKASSAASQGVVAPDFTLKDINGGAVRLSDFKGKVVLLEFWATWCPPCRATVPELVALQKEYGNRDFTVLGVSVDDQAPGLKTELLNFSRKFHINYPVLMGNDSVERKYGIWSIPRSFLIDKDGMIRDSYSGYIDQYESKVSAEVQGLL